MSGIRLGMDFRMRQDLRQVLAPRMIQSMEILQLSITDLQTKMNEALQENPFLELKEKLGETDEVAPEFNPDAPLKHDETGDLEFNRLEELNRDWDDHFNEDHRGSRASMEEEGDRKLEAMANMPDRPPSLQDYLADQIGELDLEEDERRLARHICSFVDRTGYLGARERANENDDRDTFRTVTLDEIAALYDRLVTAEDVEDTLVHVVQKLEPAGVAARDLKECLLNQVPPDAP
ncbi:MAG TPA: RNA polymerase sigma-54 factor, partial [Gemmata sp.]